jgi:acetyl-CoA C-acetyltransferase
MNSVAIVYAQRTPIGRFGGALSSFHPTELSTQLLKKGLKDTGLQSHEINSVILGQVLTAGSGQAPARQVALKAGLNESTRTQTVNHVCGSGLTAVWNSARSIALGESLICAAGGQEVMSLAPHLAFLRQGKSFGDLTLTDHMIHDGLTNFEDGDSMGICADQMALEMNFSRTELDEFALLSYKRALDASNSNQFHKEIYPIQTPTELLSKDEEPYKAKLEKIPTLKPAFCKNGVLTAANSSSLNDGAAMLILINKDEALKRNLTILATIEGFAHSGVKPREFSRAPLSGIENLLKNHKLSPKDIDLYEINEAFATVPLIVSKALKIPLEKINVKGGAVALGHPIGASGARILVTLIHALREQGKRRGIASLCIGGGESVNILIRNEF